MLLPRIPMRNYRALTLPISPRRTPRVGAKEQEKLERPLRRAREYRLLRLQRNPLGFQGVPA